MDVPESPGGGGKMGRLAFGPKKITKISSKKQAKKSRPPTLMYATEVGNFRAVVQKLTGLPGAPHHPPRLQASIPPRNSSRFFREVSASGPGDAAPAPVLYPQPFNYLQRLLLGLNYSPYPARNLQQPSLFPPAPESSTDLSRTSRSNQLVDSPLTSHLSSPMLSPKPVLETVQNTFNHHRISQHQPILKHSDLNTYPSSNITDTVDSPNPRHLRLSSNSFTFPPLAVEAYASTKTASEVYDA